MVRDPAFLGHAAAIVSGEGTPKGNPSTDGARSNELDRVVKKPVRGCSSDGTGAKDRLAGTSGKLLGNASQEVRTIRRRESALIWRILNDSDAELCPSSPLKQGLKFLATLKNFWPVAIFFGHSLFRLLSVVTFFGQWPFF